MGGLLVCLKVQIADGVASEAGLGLAMRLFNLDNFEILYEEKLQTKVKACYTSAFIDIWLAPWTNFWHCQEAQLDAVSILHSCNGFCSHWVSAHRLLYALQFTWCCSN